MSDKVIISRGASPTHPSRRCACASIFVARIGVGGRVRLFLRNQMWLFCGWSLGGTCVLRHIRIGVTEPWKLRSRERDSFLSIVNGPMAGITGYTVGNGRKLEIDVLSLPLSSLSRRWMGLDHVVMRSQAERRGRRTRARTRLR